ncbi:sugar-transfer associated ATP-grasp domain-containing protein [Altererythrobacter lutimaris]|uniref:Alpha-L-glutamate ligase-related protein ATP-grasp domain-containing protein n=1 Tax=Altererythrobacter lutimaris TaxID=2743979 RepID=A0A850HAJ9_9SPHN|nr:sugar-transfer associated ATP-grasp domain-containing protein [Altererythrobacter lutimaris]NVE93926.1 hypothetical protein [Altererythrobacter lutimaris]
MSEALAERQDETVREEISQLLAERRAIGAEERDIPLGWWYHAKKKFPLFPGLTRATGSAFLNEHYRHIEESQGPLRKLVNILTFSGFHAWLGLRTKQVAKRYKMPDGWATQAKAIARKRFVDPNDLALFRIEKPEEMDLFLRRFEHSDLNRRFNPANWTRDCLLANKIDFYLFCLDRGLSTPMLHGYFSDGRATPVSLPDADGVIVKPNDGEGGDGVELAEVPQEARGDLEVFARWIEQHCEGRKGEWIVQERLIASPELDGLALSALPTMRVTTMLNEHGKPEIVTSVLRFPSDPDTRVDNIKSGGLMAPIDPQTGVLGRGCRGRGVGEFDKHPVTDAQITGRSLESWDMTRELVLSAHDKHFRQYALVGWDIAPTTKGPMIVEGNGKPCMIVAQRANGKGLGETRYGELIAWHLAERRAGRDPLAVAAN